MSARRIVTRQDGTRRVVELSRSGRVKADWPACDSCEGTGVGTRESDEWCQLEHDGYDTNGDEWLRCTIHGHLVLADAYVCEGYRPPTCCHCGIGVRQASDPTPWVHVTTGNSFCDVACTDDAVWLRGAPDRTEANPGHDWDEYARGAMTCRRCGMVWSDTCPTECDGLMPY